MELDMVEIARLWLKRNIDEVFKEMLSEEKEIKRRNTLPRVSNLWETPWGRFLRNPATRDPNSWEGKKIVDDFGPHQFSF